MKLTLTTVCFFFALAFGGPEGANSMMSMPACNAIATAIAMVRHQLNVLLRARADVRAIVC